MRQVELLQRVGVTPVCVFDGGKLPSKAGEEEQRARKRADQLARALEHLRDGNKLAAQECFQKAVDVSPLMAARVIVQLRRAGVAFLVAPYEADAQMLHLARTGQVYAVITEDSDLVALGCERVFLKLDKDGRGTEVLFSQLSRCRELKFAGWSGEQFLHMCVLAGCDYLPSVPGVGVKKAHALLQRFRTAPAAVRHLRFEGVPVPKGYEAQLQRALFTFAHHYVYDAATRACIHLTPRSPQCAVTAQQVLEMLGVGHLGDVACGIAEGRLDPVSLQPFPEEALAALPLAPAQVAAVARMPPPPPQSNGIRNYFQRPQPGGAWGDARPSAEEAVAEAPPVLSKRARREYARADKAAAASLDSLIDDILGDRAPAPPLHSLYADRTPRTSLSPGRAPSSSTSPGSSVDPSPARPHKWALLTAPRGIAQPSARPLQAAAPPRRESRFFGASPEAQPAAAATVDAAADAATPALGVDMRHCAPMAAAASACLDKLDAFRRGQGQTPAPPTGAAGTPKRPLRASPVPFESFKLNSSAAKRK